MLEVLSSGVAKPLPLKGASNAVADPISGRRGFGGTDDYYIEKFSAALAEPMRSRAASVSHERHTLALASAPRWVVVKLSSGATQRQPDDVLPGASVRGRVLVVSDRAPTFPPRTLLVREADAHSGLKPLSGFAPARVDLALATTFDRRSSLVARIRDFAALQPDWDGYNGRPPSPGTVESALQFLKLLPEDLVLPVPTVAGDGELGFIWRKPNVFIDVGLDGAGEISFFADVGGHEWLGEEVFSGSSLPHGLSAALAALRRA